MSEKKPRHILLSSTLATTIVSALTNPLDVVKVRVQNTATSKDCSHPKVTSNSIRKASLYKLIVTPNLQEHYKIFCGCLPFRSNTKALIYLIKNEGARTLMNGLTQGLLTSVLSTVTYFLCYEEIKKQVKVFISHPVGMPLISSLTARTITTCVTFPFEYWRTLQQSVTGVNKKAGFRIGTKVNAGFTTLLQRDLLFSGLYWVLVENIRTQIKRLNQANDEGYADKKSLLISNAVAGSVSGAIASSFTLPFDVVKTRKQLDPNQYKDRSTLSVLKEIYHTEGKGALITGMRQRVTKVTISCAGILTLYELLSDILKEKC